MKISITVTEASVEDVKKLFANFSNTEIDVKLPEDTPIYRLELGKCRLRILRTCESMSVRTIADVMAYDEADFAGMMNFGETSLWSLRNAMLKAGYSW
jgi:hypothetical protein